MPLYPAMQIDRNHKVIQTNEAILSRKTLTFTGAAGLGAVGNIDIFTVTGDILGQSFAICTDNLVSAGGGSISLGLTSSLAVIIAATTATNLNAGESWVDTGPGIGEAPTATRIYPQGEDVKIAVTVADVTGGTLNCYCLWRPLSANGNLVVA